MVVGCDEPPKPGDVPYSAPRSHPWETVLMYFSALFPGEKELINGRRTETWGRIHNKNSAGNAAADGEFYFITKRRAFSRTLKLVVQKKAMKHLKS